MHIHKAVCRGVLKSQICKIIVWIFYSSHDLMFAHWSFFAFGSRSSHQISGRWGKDVNLLLAHSHARPIISMYTQTDTHKAPSYCHKKAGWKQQGLLQACVCSYGAAQYINPWCQTPARLLHTSHARRNTTWLTQISPSSNKSTFVRK